ncbi:DUF423 domain-containing protein [Conservatibacter flavescens]|uniref:DUF423 domain-containing protein n=1 Tax=Conservatibacter flavescens TaxID=28161 RepID=A0A2M8S447_9PAST|nr:DUF423 domain-containing protein [Conservatibacter flavescens]PJG85858.1 hypothetical protein CVP05_03760 [Conservatibacter flavescens]
MGNRFLVCAALSGFFLVGFGAFAAHSLEGHLSPAALLWIEKGWRYQALHTVSLLIIGCFMAATQAQSVWVQRKRAVNIIGFFWLLGIVCFSGGLYVMALLNTTAFVMFVPLGGVAFLIGWAALLYVSLRRVD